MQVPHFLALVASRCCFVGSSHRLLKRVTLKSKYVSMLQPLACNSGLVKPNHLSDFILAHVQSCISGSN